MNRPLSANLRSEILKDLGSATFDLLVIGGGITGAGIAWDAAKRGMKTVLIERNDFAFGTSSRSTKLIHGGLRYLKKGEVKLVREVGREREWLYRHAPHLVTPMPMLLPIYKGGTFGYASSSLGLFVYDRLAGVRKTERRMMHGADEAIRLEPLLKREGLKGAGRYYEYRSDDARLTVEVLKTAARHGAWVVNYVEAAEFFYFRSKAAGVRAVDRITGEEVEIRARRIVNAAGPWVDEVRARDHAVKGKHLLLTKGVHLVVDHSKLPVRQAAYFDVPDGRMIFVIPRDGKTYIGTTDTVYSGDPANPRTTEADRDYLLQAVKQAFPHTKLGADDVEAMWAGLRPLIHEEGKKPSDISRKDEIWESASGLISIAGGKLTGFRKMAEKVVDLVADSLAQEVRQAFGPCTTAKEVLSGGDSGRCETYEELKEQLIRLGVKKGLSIKTASYLVKQYGSNTADIYMRLDGLDQRFDELARLRFGSDQAPKEETDQTEQNPDPYGERNLREPEVRDNAADAVPEECSAEETTRQAEALEPEQGQSRQPAADTEETGAREDAEAGEGAEYTAAGQKPPSGLRPFGMGQPEPAPATASAASQEAASLRRAEPGSVLRASEQPGRYGGPPPASGRTGETAQPQGMYGRKVPPPGTRPERRKAPQVEVSNPETDWRALVAEIHYCIDEEMVVNADDFIVRRTGLLYFDRERAESIALDVLDIMADRLNWSESEIVEQKLRLAREWEQATVAVGKGSHRL